MGTVTVVPHWQTLGLLLPDACNWGMEQRPGRESGKAGSRPWVRPSPAVISAVSL